MKLSIYQIDAFTENIFGGNPACIVPLNKWLEDGILLKIAQENAVAETAFFIKKENFYHLRWFTPEVEMDLCGHATLASSYVIKNYIDLSCSKILFKTLSGDLNVFIENQFFTLDFPSRNPKKTVLPDLLKKSINILPQNVFKSRDFFLVYKNQKEVEDIIINTEFFNKINLSPGGVIFTAHGNNSDFVSRFFTPQASIMEDPVTGSAHCSLIPYWSNILNKKEMIAIQLSKRKGKLYCTSKKNRVLIKGKAKTYSIGNIWIP